MAAPGGDVIRRRYVHVGDRAVHYRRTGSGPPVVLVHQSPQSSAGLVPLMRLLAPHATVFAFDTPGCGDSDPLLQRRPRIGEFAAALVETLDALGIGRFALFGTKTGACIALELACRFPERVLGVVLDSLPLFTPREVADITHVAKSDDGDDAYYLMPFRATWDGAHLTTTWSHVRDHIFWFPWYRRRGANRRDIDMPSPSTMHEGVLDNFRAGDNLRTVVEAAFRYPAKAAVETLRVPALFMARADSMLFHCLDMLPRLAAGQRIKKLGRDMDVYRRTLVKALRGYASGDSPPDHEPRDIPRRVTRTFVDRRPRGQVLVRRLMVRSGRPILLLHDVPGSSQALAPLINGLGQRRPVVAPDFPGCGDSDPLRAGRRSLDVYVGAVRDVLDHGGWPIVDVYGVGVGAAIALRLTARHGERVAGLVLEDLPRWTKEERREFTHAYTPPIEPTWDGGHLYRTWLMLRDQHAYWPWYRRTRMAIRRVDLTLRPEELQARLLEVLKAYRSYGEAFQAAVRYRPEPDLRGLTRAFVVLGEPTSPMTDRWRGIVKINPRARIVSSAPTPARLLRLLRG
ncbi:MAG: alpha/beta fold hydrolase [Alphaproteobacteria bacterium]|nr:alpha/beta fold hydrolase [Alphaproteobacteria bacterium]